MYRRLALRSLAIVAAVAVLVFATAALSHGHINQDSQEDSHCSLCMALHSGKHVLASPVVALQFTPIQLALQADTDCVVFVSGLSLPAHDRAPPLTE
jgi:hypothetical protein